MVLAPWGVPETGRTRLPAARMPAPVRVTFVRPGLRTPGAATHPTCRQPPPPLLSHWPAHQAQARRQAGRPGRPRRARMSRRTPARAPPRPARRAARPAAAAQTTTPRRAARPAAPARARGAVGTGARRATRGGAARVRGRLPAALSEAAYPTLRPWPGCGRAPRHCTWRVPS